MCLTSFAFVHATLFLYWSHFSGVWTLEIYFNVSIMSFAFVQDAGVHALSNVCHIDVERISKRKPGEVVCTQNPFFFLNTDYSPGLVCIYWHSKLISFFIFAC